MLANANITDMAHPANGTLIAGEIPGQTTGPAFISVALGRRDMIRVEERLSRIIANELHVEGTQIKPTARFAADLGADPFGVLEVIVRLRTNSGSTSRMTHW